MKSILSFWKTSPPEQKDYLFIYAWGVIWALVYLVATPVATLNVFGTVLVVLWTATTAVGGILSIVGLVKRDNLIVERFGINLLTIGPLAYALTQLGLLLFAATTGIGDPYARIHLVFFALWPYLFLNKRRRQIKARVRLVKKLPLLDEPRD